MSGDGDSEVLSDERERGAELAECLASSFERLAATYREIANDSPSAEKRSRLLMHAARLQQRAEHELSEAARFREIISREHADTPVLPR